LSTRALSRSPKFGLIVAAGRGRRFGGLKQFARIKGKPALIHSIMVFERARAVSGFVVVTTKERVGYVRTLLRQQGVTKLLDVVAGGLRRMDSVAAGLTALPDDGCVAIHDAARPVISARMLEQGFRACRRYGAATFGHPVTDTLKCVHAGAITETVDRESLIAVQTPQFFHLSLLRRAYAKARNAGVEATDDCALVESLGIQPRWLEGPRTNLKITTPEDLALCEALL
jgi:2-C-methyl-D-erythritol 4-phosphate cytidylyltransferase